MTYTTRKNRPSRNFMPLLDKPHTSSFHHTIEPLLMPISALILTIEIDNSFGAGVQITTRQPEYLLDQCFQPDFILLFPALPAI